MQKPDFPLMTPFWGFGTCFGPVCCDWGFPAMLYFKYCLSVHLAELCELPFLCQLETQCFRLIVLWKSVSFFPLLPWVFKRHLPLCYQAGMTKLSKEQLEEALGEENGSGTKREENTPLSHSTKSLRYFPHSKQLKRRVLFFFKSLLKKERHKQTKQRRGKNCFILCNCGEGSCIVWPKKLYGTESLDNQLSAGDICVGWPPDPQREYSEGWGERCLYPLHGLEDSRTAHEKELHNY